MSRSPRPEMEKARMFDGKKFDFWGYFFSSSDANFLKNALKKQGHLVRIVKKNPNNRLGKAGGYWIYARK